MLYNYHTHTALCNHAEGEMHEYVENAIAGGLQTLGFSDHAPYLFPDGTQSYYRMRTEEIFAYAESVRALAKAYAKDIRILCGFELEYYPDLHADEMAFLKQVHPDYILLGQHFLGNEEVNVFRPPQRTDQLLADYVTQALEGLATGDFDYIAHPDLPGYAYSDAAIEREYRRLCEGAKKLHIPLELNLLGIRSKRCYPGRRLFEIAGQAGNDIVFGTDAHSPKDTCDPVSEAVARKWVREMGLHLLEKPFI